MRALRIVFIGLFALLLGAPASLYFLGFQQGNRLAGKSSAAAPLKISLDAFMQTKLQSRFEEWFKRRSAGWGYLVRSENQLNYSLFSIMSSNYRSMVVQGADRHLIERAYIASANRLNARSNMQRIEQRVKQLKELQDLLAARGIFLKVIISPNKPSLYPELLPADHRVPGAEMRQGAYEQLLPLLAKYSISVLDFHEFFWTQKSSAAQRFFASSGTHWSMYAACLASQRLQQSLAQESGLPLLQLICEPTKLRLPYGIDTDLSQLANLWFPERTYSLTPYPQHRRLAPPENKNAGREQILFVGSSFMWPVLHYYDRNRLFARRIFYYYFRRRVTFPKPSSRPIDPLVIDWENDLLGSKFVVIEINHAFVYKLGFGFVEAALAHLERR